MGGCFCNRGDHRSLDVQGAALRKFQIGRRVWGPGGLSLEGQRMSWEQKEIKRKVGREPIKKGLEF